MLLIWLIGLDINWFIELIKTVEEGVVNLTSTLPVLTLVSINVNGTKIKCGIHFLHSFLNLRLIINITITNKLKILTRPVSGFSLVIIVSCQTNNLAIKHDKESVEDGYGLP